jgi:ABC-type lipoprotein release transport system permease subunit
MKRDSLVSAVSVVLVVLGVAVLIAGVGLYHSVPVQIAGGAISLLGVGVLAVYLERLDAPETAH